MPYKVFLVEDELVTRQGIRDNVDWAGAGFAFCGDAGDGELALPLIQAAQPHLIITDIKMPFMDGLELCAIARRRWPWIKTIILSGHDEFEYAQQAIRLGVTEYLLKPVSREDLKAALERTATALDRERDEQEQLDRLAHQVAEQRGLLHERLLLRLAVGAISPADAISQALALGVDLAARCYLVAVIRVLPPEHAAGLGYGEQSHVQRAVASLVDRDPDVFLVSKDLDELVLIMKGETAEYLQEARDALLERIATATAGIPCRLLVGRGAPIRRSADISRSFAEALASIEGAAAKKSAADAAVDRAELIKVDRSAVEDYLKCGTREDFDAFFAASIQPLGDALKSYMVRNYIVMDLAVTTARFLEALGGDAPTPGLDEVDALVAGLDSIEQLREYAQKTLLAALTHRDGHAGRQHATMLQQATRYVERHFMDPNISLNEVAGQVNHSPSHFSAVFSQEMGVTFKEHLTAVRIKRARELLRTTSARTYEIAYQVGYADPHYFSYVFRKETGQTPSEYRGQGHSDG